MAEPDLGAYREAERLVREAQARAEAAARAAHEVPPAGWAGTGADGPRGAPFPDLTALLALLEAGREALPPELARQVADALRELLVALRAVLDHSIARLERPEAPARKVEDIPVE